MDTVVVDTVVVDTVVDIIELTQEARKKMTVELKENLLHQLLAWRCSVKMETLKAGAERAGLCKSYPELDGAVNELITEKKIVLYLTNEGTVCLSPKYR